MERLRKIWQWIDDRSGISALVVPLAKHLVPPGSKWSYVFGSATLFCLMLQVVTGIGLSLLYQPSSDTAYQSLVLISANTLSAWLRGIHYFGASGMILLMGLHMIRVFLTAAYKFPRELQWITGIVLLLLTIVMGFTGQLLRWDDTGVWSAVVAAEQLGRIPVIGKAIAYFLLGGETVGGYTLGRFYSYHVFIVPALLFGFTAFHVYLVFRNGISEPPKVGRLVDPKKYRVWYEKMLEKKGVPFFPDAAWRDMVFGFCVICIIALSAYFIGAPKLVGPPDPASINANPAPDWYLSWIFALFALMPPKIESYVIAFGPPVLIFLLLALPFLSNKGERHPLRRPWAILGVAMTVAIVIALSIEGMKAPWSPVFDVKPLPASTLDTSDKKLLKGMRLFYDKGCLYCHKIGDRGGLRGPDLTNVSRRLNRQEMTIRIVNGGEYMPAFGGSLSQEELDLIINFLENVSDAKVSR
ncbi:cytochrome b (plasmid) [Fulvitalea axinellae]|uniref:Cytochrome b n=1 Tax=Fulvitalea axinellae TaxID=1182444 RepID=A0AAU9CJZ1_9BACT|nr:cytochrome b [Fulvitalea axinellae]